MSVTRRINNVSRRRNRCHCRRHRHRWSDVLAPKICLAATRVCKTIIDIHLSSSPRLLRDPNHSVIPTAPHQKSRPKGQFFELHEQRFPTEGWRSTIFDSTYEKISSPQLQETYPRIHNCWCYERPNKFTKWLCSSHLEKRNLTTSHRNALNVC